MDNLDRLKMRAQYAENDRQHDRMIVHKRKSLQRALLYSYQSAWIKKDAAQSEYIRALINPDTVKFDYDEKILSVDFQYNFQAGDSFEWKGTNTHWMILKTELTELAYLRGNIRRCQLIEATDNDTKEKLQIWASIRGPVETKITSVQKGGLVVDTPNLSLNIYLKNSEQNKQIFARYKNFEFMNRFWEVQAVDDISTPNIIQLSALENFDCKNEDFSLVAVDPNKDIPEAIAISGETFIKPLTSVTYHINSLIDNVHWLITPGASLNKDIEDVIESHVLDNGDITIKWTSLISGSFVLHYGEYNKTIIVESLF